MKKTEYVVELEYTKVNGVQVRTFLHHKDASIQFFSSNIDAAYYGKEHCRIHNGVSYRVMRVEEAK